MLKSFFLCYLTSSQVWAHPINQRGEWNTELGFVVKVNIQCSSNIVFNSLVIRIKCPLNIVLNGQVL